MTTLKDNLNSDFLGAFVKLKPKKAPKTITVYVESDDDIAFWRNILNPFENQEIKFEIHLPSNTLAKGKGKALQRSNEIFNYLSDKSLGKYLLICVDSDYDYLLNDYSVYSRLINNNDFIFQTYSYSIENLKCFSESLHQICVSATLNDNVLIDLNELLKLYSKIVFELFLWNLYFYKIGDFNSFTLTMFCDTIRILEVPKISEHGKTAIENLNVRVKQKLNELETEFPDKIFEIRNLGSSLEELGLNSENAYLFIQGHTIFDNVVLMFVKEVFNLLKEEKINTIKSLAKTGIEKGDNINYYHKRIVDIGTLISNNYEFKQCFLYQKIESDIKQYISILNN